MAYLCKGKKYDLKLVALELGEKVTAWHKLYSGIFLWLEYLVVFSNIFIVHLGRVLL